MATPRESALCLLWGKILGHFRDGDVDEAQEAADVYDKIELMSDEEFENAGNQP